MNRGNRSGLWVICVGVSALAGIGALQSLGCSSSPKSTDAGPDSGASTTDSGVDSGTSDAGAECASYAAAYCSFLAACEPGTLQTTYANTSSCISQRTTDCLNNLTAPNSAYTPTWVASCSTSYNTNAAACDGGPVPLPVPTPSDPCALVGPGPGGSNCGVDSQCATDLCNRVGTLCGQCTGQGSAGQPCGPGTGITCVRGLTCGRKDTCIPISGVGGGCDNAETADCVGGTNCVLASGADSGTCQASGAKAGLPCNEGGIATPRCSEIGGFFCNTVTSECEPITYAAAAASCGVDGGSDGGIITSDIECQAGTCVTGTCSARGIAGGGCTVGAGAGCVDGTICVADPAGLAGTCTAVQQDCSAADGGMDFNFSPSNISLAQIFSQVSTAADENLSSACQIITDATNPSALCFNSAITPVTQTDGTTVNLMVMSSLTLQSLANVVVTGGVPLVMVSLSSITLEGGAFIDANSSTAANTNGPGGGTQAAAFTAGIPAIGGGLAGNMAGSVGGGGGSYCGVGGGGGAGPSSIYGTRELRPLEGGASGGGGWDPEGGGGGGGALQLVAVGSITLNAGAFINAGGGGGVDASGAAVTTGGGGSGGGVLLEAPNVVLAGTLAANGGGGGGSGNEAGGDGTADSTPAAGGPNGTGASAGGQGSAGATLAGSPGTADGGPYHGGGGGGAGYIRLNSGTASAATTGGTISPALTTRCATQANLRSITDGP
jgi:hypothetical protein